LENGTFNPTKVFQYPEDIPWRTYQNNASIRNPDGSIWVAQNKGLYLWDTIPDFKQPAVLDHNSMDLMRLDDGSMLFATSRGLYRNESYRSRDLQLVYGGISARSLALDHKGRLWVGAQDGLYLFIEENGQFHIKARLMASQNINCLLFAPADQSLWIGTDQGLFRTSVEDAVAYHQQPPSIRITELITADSSYLFPHKVELPSDNNYLSFQISTLEFQTPSSLEVQYRLNGREWQELRGSELQFAAMADGKYQLDLQVSNDGLQWSEPARMIFEIAPPFWKSPWAYAVSSLLAIIMITLFSFRRIRNVKKREAEKRYLQKKLTELEQQALGAMMNPHFIFNTLNSIQHFFNQNDPAEANEYLARFAQLIRSNMEVVQKPQTLLDEELERLQLYLELEQLRFGDRMEYKVFVDPEIDPEEIMIPSMLMQPFVENAIWHGIAKSQELGWVEIRLEMIDDEILRIRIDDNGPGVFTSQNSRKSAHRSRGVEIV
ncbi:MAG: histidine kinase, partial [Bacteroidota bacterium]